MRNIARKLSIAIVAIVFLLFLGIPSFAHSGGTDSSGGHRDNNNKSGLGYYHYHCGGNPPHLHSGGYCPYQGGGYDDYSYDYGSGSSGNNSYRVPTGIALSCRDTTIYKGDTAYITATIYPENAYETDLAWRSSDSNIVSVTGGRIKAVDYGVATITAQTLNGVTDSINITVEEIKAQKVTISGIQENQNLYVGDSFDLKTDIFPQSTANKNVTWSTSDESVATVSLLGNVTLVGTGTVRIRATASNGVFDEVILTAKQKEVESIIILNDDIIAKVGEKYELTAVILPADAQDKELIWKVEDPSVLQIMEDGVIEAIAVGETVITATAPNGVSDSVVVKVSNVVVEKIEIDGYGYLFVGEEAEYRVSVFPKVWVAEDEVLWSVSDDSIARIDYSSGKFVGLKEGEVIVFASYDDVEAQKIVKIEMPEIEEFEIECRSRLVPLGDAITFSYKMDSPEAEYAGVTWGVSDTSSVTIDSDGVLTAYTSGLFTVYAIAGDGSVSQYTIYIYDQFTETMFYLLIIGGIVLLVRRTRKKRQAKNQH